MPVRGRTARREGPEFPQPQAALAWTGRVVIEALERDTLVSLPEVSVQITQSVIPIGAVLFVFCEALSLPDYLRRVRAGLSHEAPPADGGPDSSGEEAAP